MAQFVTRASATDEVVQPRRTRCTLPHGEEVDRGVRLSQDEEGGYLMLPDVCGPAGSRPRR